VEPFKTCHTSALQYSTVQYLWMEAEENYMAGNFTLLTQYHMRDRIE